MKTGLVRWEWHSLDHVGASESETPAPTSAAPWDWFHINSIDPQPDGNIFISARSTWAGYQLEGGSGNILWRLGGLKSSFKMGPGTETAWQHDGRILSSGEVTFFDDGSNPPSTSSRAVCGSRSTQDPRSAPDRGIHAPRSALLTPSQGNMQTLADGNAVVGYGGVPAISEFAREARCCSTPTCPSTCPSIARSASPGAGARHSAGCARQLEQHRRRDDRAHELERRQAKWPPGACLRENKPESLAARTTISGKRLRKLDDPDQEVRLRGSTGAWTLRASVLGSSSPSRSALRRRAAFRRSSRDRARMLSRPVLWSACAEPCPSCSSCRSSAWRSSCSLFYRRTLPPPAWPQDGQQR